MMRPRSRSIWRIALGAVGLVLLSADTRAAERSQPAPDIDMRDGQGRRVRLSDFRGRVVLVDLWASWCPPCQKSFPALDALHREYRARGVEIVAVNLDERRKNADTFLKAHPHEMLVVFDPGARVLEAFGARGVPSSYLIDRHGRVRYSHEGYTADTLNAYRWQLDALLAEAAR